MNALLQKIGVLISLIILFFSTNELRAQSKPHSLAPDVQVELVKSVPVLCSRIEADPISGNIFYAELAGKIHRLIITGTQVKDTVLFNTSNHHITNVCGMAFRDSTLFLVGNETIDTTQKFGLVMRGKLKPNGNRIWDTVAITQPYPAGNTTFDHGFGGIAISPAADSIYICSGSRSDHGEEENNNGLYPGLREVPLTSAIFRIPYTAKNLFLPADSAGLAPYLFADGLRNTFDLAFNTAGDLIGGENAGERDDPDELNWLRYGRNYGFPWIMGGDYNPQQYPGYDPDADIMLNKNRYGYKNGFFHDDPTFPPRPASLVVTPGIENYGPDADYYRDTITGTVMNVSDLGTYMIGITPHRSPLGIVFDVNQALREGYKGDGFMLSFEVKGDSAGNTPSGITGTVLDSSQDLVHLHFVKNAAGDNYTATCTRIVGGFFKPVDACIKGNLIYVLEYSSGNNPVKIWKVTLPLDTLSITTGAIPASLCPDQQVSVPYTAAGPFNPGNIFTAQLSKPSGSFTAPLTIGTLSSTVSGTIDAHIPSNGSGTAYRIRVVSSNPAVTGTDNGANIQIKCLPPATFSATSIKATSAKLTWSAVSCGKSYQLKYQATGGIWKTVNLTATFKTIKNLLPSTNYQWKVKTKCVDNPALYSSFSAVQSFTTKAVKEEGESEVMNAVEALTVYPNPFSKNATIEFFLDKQQYVHLSLFDVTGRKVRTLLEGNFGEGMEQVKLAADGLNAGIYFLQLKTGDSMITRKVVIE